MKTLKHIIGIPLVLCIGAVIGWQGTVQGWASDVADFFGDGSSVSQEMSGVWHDNVDLDLFWAVWKIVETDYVDESLVDADEMVYGAVKGMVNSLGDPYTVFMDPEETEEFTSSLEGQLEGIGAELTVDEGVLTVVTPLKNSPAERAGVIPGDIIYQIEGEYAMEMTFFDAIMSIRGEKGTPVTLTLIRKGLEDPFDVTIIRAEIDVESVTKEVLDDGIVYLSVNQFSDTTSDEFGKAIADLILSEPPGLIVDLRYNGGGYLDVAVELLSYLLETNLPAVEIHERHPENDDVIFTNGGPKLLNIPLIVLVNEGSASASEIVAGAIQDHDRGVVMGVQSFGKGTVQEVEFLEDGSSVRLTIAQWYTPDGRIIQKVGITPDIIVEMYDDDYENDYDRQLEEARKYLNNL